MTTITSRGSKIYPGVLQSIASSSVSGTYQALGTFSFPVRVFKITNNSNEDVTVSWDGTIDHEYVPAGSFILLDCAANREVSNIFGAAAGITLYVKGTGGTGNVYLSYYYAVSV